MPSSSIRISSTPLIGTFKAFWNEHGLPRCVTLQLPLPPSGPNVRLPAFQVSNDAEEGIEPDPKNVQQPEGTPSSGASHGERPSEYLRARCPLCFGGTTCSSEDGIPDIIVCIDACFTQKRRKGQGGGRDDPRHARESVFVPESDVKDMESYVESLRPSSDNRPHHTQPTVEEEDEYEPGLKLPRSVLDGCHESFLAADEKRQKASMQLFADTGLMALLCHHDRVLWLVNMTSAGEKQYYALTLIRRLFDNLPASMTKGIGFGLTDGESCERFWSAIRKLIPSLRVSRYHQRLFVLDTQVKHLDEESMSGLGHWLFRKWSVCQSKKCAAIDALQMLGIEEDVLRAEWVAQVEEQMKPAPRRSRDKGKRAIETVLALQKTLVAYQENIRDLELKLLADNDVLDTQEIDLQLVDARSKSARIASALEHKKAALGIGERAQLVRLARNVFLRIRMNARAIKHRIRDHLHQCKFELERLERSYRQTINNNKLSTHAESSIKRREPSILKLAKTYNDLCMQMSTLIRQRKAPRFAIVPPPIQSNGLFKLDVDDDIWQDVGLDDDVDTDAVPRWLGDETVREGIKMRLLLDRCIEEESRLQRERCALQEWFQEEWLTLQKACVDADNDIDLLYLLHRRRDRLSRLCVTWQSQVHAILCLTPMSSSWGPSEQELRDAAVYQVTGKWDKDESLMAQYNPGENQDDDEERVSFDPPTDSEDDGELVDAAEVVAFNDAYHELLANPDLDTLLLDSSIVDDTKLLPVSPSRYTPRKRALLIV
ncbi:hypothetical protein SCP_0201770 [Sparassis crispa]|uniref:CxC1-like cysteine cluster associated with KDZ transposases domain-containing protein n=1 Tax=Sparassis crispa TaxID=139825 RepID=A0A401G9Y4_9APHY|nr:hypothetical protein SCP_0201770 [Sparassis crispa]GBE78980.1 hypothetical protein SCP_0201770 [Sparassis crispa]